MRGFAYFRRFVAGSTSGTAAKRTPHAICSADSRRLIRRYCLTLRRSVSISNVFALSLLWLSSLPDHFMKRQLELLALDSRFSPSTLNPEPFLEIHMLRRFSLVAVAVCLSGPVLAQSPEGWQMRVDRSTNANDPDNVPTIKFEKMGPGFHVTTGPAAALYNSKNSVSGAYTLKGTFHLMKPSGHNNYYGLVFGASELDGPNQSYLYFLVSQNGTYVIKHRAGDATTHDVQSRTAHAAIIRPDSSTGKSANALEVRVGADRIDYVVNGTVVHTTPKSGMTARTDGIWGVRINHQLEVHVDGLGVSK